MIDLSNIHVYFQDEDNAIREYVGTRYSSDW
jgi:hypothetical protein